MVMMASSLMLFAGCNKEQRCIDKLEKLVNKTEQKADQLDKEQWREAVTEYKEICAETKKERMYERIAQEDMRKIAKERDAVAMRKYVEDMNPVMQEMGLKELRLPSWAQADEANIETIEN